jgi:hypothetical protein
MFSSLRSHFDQWRERRRKRLRVRFYGLGPGGDHLAILLSWVLVGSVLATLDSRGVAVPFWPFCAFLFVPVPFWFWLDWWLGKRQRRRDVARALASMKLPLRRRLEIDGTCVDFDPDFIALLPNGKYVWALDRRRRLMRFIMANTKNGDYVWPFDVTAVKVELIDAPARRRFFGLLSAPRNAPSPYLSVFVTVVGQEGSETVHDLPFRHEDRKIAEKWRDTLLDWARDDQRAAALKASGR